MKLAQASQQATAESGNEFDIEQGHELEVRSEHEPCLLSPPKLTLGNGRKRRLGDWKVSD